MTGNKFALQIFTSLFLFVAELQRQNFHLCYFVINLPKFSIQLKMIHATEQTIY